MLFAEAELTWQYILEDRKKRKSTNSVTVYCERLANVYSKNPPSAPKPTQKLSLLKSLKTKSNFLERRVPPLPPLVPKILSTCYPLPALSMSMENGIKQHSEEMEVSNDKFLNEYRDDQPRWIGLENFLLTCKEYFEGNFQTFILIVLFSLPRK